MKHKHIALKFNDGISDTTPKVVSEVKTLQKCLIKLKFLGANESADGKFGPKTEAAVKSFQGKHSLTQDGIVGRNTWAALAGVSPSEVEIIPRPSPSVSPTDFVTAKFTLKQDKSNQLIKGSLTFSQNGKQLLSVVATSGLPGYQYAGAHTKFEKGCIPPANNWKIATSGYSSNKPGIAGIFYPITPDQFGRGGFGLHRDANVPGSAGCIVVEDSNTFNNKVVPFLNGLKNKQSQIPLSVVYT